MDALLGESNNRGNRAVDSSSARSVPKPHFGGPAAVDGHHPGIGAPSLRIADTIRANAFGHPGGTMSAGGHRC
ncbi:hypothetical protein CFB81_25865 [Burkholderia sp. AU28863]|uniref:hypothetical protein n=1 Tax=Burkholderia sp. AU28863 TaxID=2015352 RepID=UPI000B7AA026|nr:hypothetical protein [Burkholderia sp. AU28863]OXI68034.1 hypothetical protein CFB81_25865 [Burkholderia sp. AU28863]